MNRSYVYALTYDDEVLYVGKGTGRRLAIQCRAFGLQGRELARFKREREAYAFERETIERLKPRLNVCAGGNGSWATPQRKRRLTQVEKEIERLGTRLYAINLLKRFGVGFDLDWDGLSKVEAELRGLSHG